MSIPAGNAFASTWTSRSMMKPRWPVLMVGPDELSRVVNYEKIVVAVRAIVGSGHTRLVETMAERIAEACLRDARVRTARIRVEKLDVFRRCGRRPAWKSQRRAPRPEALAGTPSHALREFGSSAWRRLSNVACGGFPVGPVAISQNLAEPRTGPSPECRHARSVVTVVEMTFAPLDDGVSFAVCDQQMTCHASATTYSVALSIVNGSRSDQAARATGRYGRAWPP